MATSAIHKGSIGYQFVNGYFFEFSYAVTYYFYRLTSVVNGRDVGGKWNVSEYKIKLFNINQNYKLLWHNRVKQ